MKINHVIITIISFFTGILFFAYLQEIIIIRNPLAKQQVIRQLKKKQITYFFWYRNNWHTEKKDIIWDENNIQHNIYYLVNSWLTILDDENIVKKKVILQSALTTSPPHTAYLSFDRNPFDKEQTIHEKWMWAEGLLRTLRENNITIQQVQCLVRHQLLDDYHLDFSRPWSLQGFLQKTT